MELMYENGKMRPVQTILRMGGEKIKEDGGAGEFKIYRKHFCNMSQCNPSTTI
jgi:hypothetical protein